MKVKEFQPWLDHKQNSTKNIVTAYCKAFHKQIQNEKSDISKHSERESNKAAMIVFLAWEEEKDREKKFF
jgi:hypothetical protein